MLLTLLLNPIEYHVRDDRTSDNRLVSTSLLLDVDFELPVESENGTASTKSLSAFGFPDLLGICKLRLSSNFLFRPRLHSPRHMRPSYGIPSLLSLLRCFALSNLHPPCCLLLPFSSRVCSTLNKRGPDCRIAETAHSRLPPSCFLL